jgi:hypothetical protein
MAGETQKSTALTNTQANTTRDARLRAGKLVTALDTHQFAAATELEAADVIIFDICIPSNAIILNIEVQNDDLDTHACSPTLATDFGLHAAEAFTSTTSSSDTNHAVDGVLDLDLLVDGVTTLQAASTNWVSLVPDATTWGPEDRLKPVWELLGYDNDPKFKANLSMTSATASAALSSAADLAVRVTYLVD